MNRIALMTAATLTITAPAFAYTGVSPTLVQSAESVLEGAGMANVDMQTLSDEQIIEIYFAGQEDEAGERNLKIEAALNDGGYGRTITERRVILTEADPSGLMPAGESSVVNSVQNFLDSNGFEVDASKLTDAQVAELYFLGFSGEDTYQGGADRIETILNM